MRPLAHPALDDITLAGILYALSDETRAAIFVDIAGSSCSQRCAAFSTVSERIVPKSTLSQHFKTLREAGLIHSERQASKCSTRRDARRSRRVFPSPSSDHRRLFETGETALIGEPPETEEPARFAPCEPKGRSRDRRTCGACGPRRVRCTARIAKPEQTARWMDGQPHGRTASRRRPADGDGSRRTFSSPKREAP